MPAWGTSRAIWSKRPTGPRHGRLKAAGIGLVTLAMCLTLTGATPAPVVRSPAFAIPGMDRIPSPPAGTSWAPAVRQAAGLNLVATAGDGRFALYTVDGDRTSCPGSTWAAPRPGTSRASDPSAHRVAVPRRSGSGVATAPRAPDRVSASPCRHPAPTSSSGT